MTLLCNFKKRWDIFSNFVAFSQYMNFIWISKPDETRHHEPIVVSKDTIFNTIYFPDICH